MMRKIRPLLVWFRQRLPQVTPNDSVQLQTSLLYEAVISPSYLILVTGSSVIATLGLMANSPAVIIGAMIIAPLILPVRGLALGALEGNVLLFKAGAISILVGTVQAISISCVLGWLVDLPNWGSEIVNRTRPNLLDLGVALAAGTIGGYARTRPQVSDSLAGVAIAVALMPPVCVIGLGLSQGDWQASWGASQLYLTNLLGIALACMITFLVLGYVPLHKAHSALLPTLGMISLLVIPLGANLTRLLTQAELEASLRRALLRGTITFQRVQLLSSEFNWVTVPPQVILVVQSTEPVTPKQVGLLEDFAEEAVGRPFTLIFRVAQTQEVTSTLPSPTPSPVPSPLPSPLLSPLPPPNLISPSPGSSSPSPELSSTPSTPSADVTLVPTDTDSVAEGNPDSSNP